METLIKNLPKCLLGHNFKFSKEGFGKKSLYYCPICKYWIHKDEYELQKNYTWKH